MQRGHCQTGTVLFHAYQEECGRWVTADARKRRVVVSAPRDLWREIARQVEDAKLEFERARCRYIEHVVNCKNCDWEQLANAYLDQMTCMTGKPSLEETA